MTIFKSLSAEHLSVLKALKKWVRQFANGTNPGSNFPHGPVPARFKSRSVFLATHLVIGHDILLTYRTRNGCLLIFTRRRGFERTKRFMHTALKLSLDPVTCKEALFKRCFNARWQRPPLSVPSPPVSAANWVLWWFSVHCTPVSRTCPGAQVMMSRWIHRFWSFLRDHTGVFREVV